MRQDEFQRARRISRAIQEYLINTGSNGIRSTDIYPYLARNGYIEKDMNNGLKFRLFLKKLYTEGTLQSVIPQCKPQKSGWSNEQIEWWFYQVKEKNVQNHTRVDDSKNNENDKIQIRVFEPIMIDKEADEIINKLKFSIDQLPKKPKDSFSYVEKEIRKMYPRAYEIWTEKEIEIARIAYRLFRKLNKVAKLLRRQPSAVEMKLRSRGIIE